MSLFILLLIALNEETNETLIDSINYCNMKEICETTYTIKKSPPFQTLLKKKKKRINFVETKLMKNSNYLFQEVNKTTFFNEE